MEEERTSYKSGDKCTHCGGNVSGHCEGEQIINWCDDCGSNNPKSPPNVELTFG